MTTPTTTERVSFHIDEVSQDHLILVDGLVVGLLGQAANSPLWGWSARVNGRSKNTFASRQFFRRPDTAKAHLMKWVNEVLA